MHTKIQSFVFLIFLGFSSASYAGIFSFLKASLNCEKTYRRTLKDSELSLKQKIKLEKKAELCLQKEELKWAVLIWERLLKESKAEERKKWEEQLARAAFERERNYSRALKHYTRLLKKSPEQKFEIQHRIAESYFYLKKYSQALRELEKCFSPALSIEKRKKALVLKARILMAERQFLPAIQLFEQQIRDFPKEEMFFREYLALIYESKKDFLSAVRELEKIKPQSPFIQSKMRRLMERQTNQPGFR